jgi:hypothetical protein
LKRSAAQAVNMRKVIIGEILLEIFFDPFLDPQYNSDLVVFQVSGYGNRKNTLRYQSQQ